MICSKHESVADRAAIRRTGVSSESLVSGLALRNCNSLATSSPK